MVQLGLRVAQFYMHESCGKCTPCREGTRWMVDLLAQDRSGRREPRASSTSLLDVCDRILGNCLCPLGDAAAMPVASYVAKFRDEFQRHLDEGGCPFGGESSLDGRDRAGRPAPRTGARGHRGARVTGLSALGATALTVDASTSREHPGRRKGERRRSSRRRRPRLVETAALRRIEIPVFCYEPRLGAAGRRLPHVPLRGRGHAEAPGRLHADRAGRPRPAHGRRRARRRPRARTRSSSSSSSTTRSTAPTATRAASARCRT